MAEPVGCSGTPSIRKPGPKPDSPVRALDASAPNREAFGRFPDDPGIERLDAADGGAASLTPPFRHPA